MSTSDRGNSAAVVGWNRMRRRGCGFTLIELVITLAVAAILAAIAIPAYTDFMQRSRRTDAMTSLLNVANHQEQYRTRTLTYATNVGQLGLSATSPESYYSLTINPSNGTFEAVATAVPGNTQYQDTQCRSFTIDSQGCYMAFPVGDSIPFDCPTDETISTRKCWKR